MNPAVGILAVQGDVEAHGRALRAVGAAPRRVLRAAELADCAALVLPGGESTTIAMGVERLGLWTPLRNFAASGRPILGTCAGAILLARQSRNAPVPTLGLLAAAALRNAYGSQVDSFAAPVDDGARCGLDGLRCTFIRAPRLCELGPGVQVLARVEGWPVLVRQQNVLAATFHPELGGDCRVHGLLMRLLLR